MLRIVPAYRSTAPNTLLPLAPVHRLGPFGRHDPAEGAGTAMVAEPMMSSCHSCLDRGVPSAGSRPALFTRTDSSRRCRILGEDSPRILASVSNLTGCIGALGEHEQTRRLGEWIWPSTERDLLAVCLVRPTPQHPAAPRLRSSTARATLTITTEVSTQLTTISHKCFLSYHHEDEVLVQQFIEEFDDRHDVFITRGIRAPEDIIDSDDTEYVMAQIRKRFLTDSTVTIVLIGKCTWARRFCRLGDPVFAAAACRWYAKRLARHPP
jgi:hypothetical protein